MRATKSLLLTFIGCLAMLQPERLYADGTDNVRDEMPILRAKINTAEPENLAK